MLTPPLGRAPIEAGPAWNDDGTIKPVWQRWFNSLASNLQNSNQSTTISSSMSQSLSGATEQSVIITVLGLVSLLQNPRSTKSVDDVSRIALMSGRSRTISPQIVITLQAGAAALIPTLAANTFIYVSDYAHMLFWDGSTSTFADDGSDYYVIGQRRSASIGWHAVDGTANVKYLKADGTTGLVTLDNVAAVKAYLAAGSGADVLSTAVVGTTDPASTGIASGSVNAGAGTPTAIMTPPDPQHSHTISNPGEPANFYSILWYRQ